MTFINDFMSLIYPRHCEACGNTLYRHEQFICSYCIINLPRSNYHLLPDNEISLLLRGRVPADMATSYFLYEKKGRVQSLLHAIKYHNQKELAAHLGRFYARELRQQGAMENIETIVPIPLHPKKLKARGYNQSEWFARGVAEELDKELNTTDLFRAVETSTQTRKKKYERWENVGGIFGLRPAHRLEGKHVLLVDDVITTGATIEAAWLALQQAPGLKIAVASIAFASKSA